MSLPHPLRTLVPMAAALLIALPATARDVLPAPGAMVLDGVPPVPAALAKQLAKYNDFRPTRFSAWHPTKPEMLIVRRHKNTPQVFRVAKPGAAPELVTDYVEPIRSAGFEPREGKYIVFARDSGGNEVFRAYRRDLAGGEAVPFTPENQRVQDLAWSESGREVVYVTVPVNRKNAQDKADSTVSIADPLKPESARKIATLEGGGWLGFDFSPDDKQLAYLEFKSANESYLWVMDATTGTAKRITDKHNGETVSYGEPQWSRDGKGLYVVTDRGAEFQHLNYIDLATGKHTVLTADIPWDIETITLSKDGRHLAFVANEDGTFVLRLMATAGHKLLPLPKLPLGTLGGVRWHKDGNHLGFHITSATSPAEAYSVNIKTGQLTRWTTHEPMEVDASTFPEPEMVRWKSFDGRMISGFAYKAPAAKFPGKRPVLINIHGGPESQATTGFLGRGNYLITELGVTMLFPNVRGSSGYGKSFLKLDNGKLREDSVKDIGALLDWIATQPDLDASRVAVMGGSYGGYMSLAVATMYPERIAGAIDIVGVSNFVTFLERTESYRRDLRRVEYGDERDPEMRKWMEETAPVNRAHRIKRPLFVVQGRNDPRVPWQEADQIVNTVKKNGTPVWYMTANDEGHGFAKKVNADYQYFSTLMFLERVLKVDAGPAARPAG